VTNHLVKAIEISGLRVGREKRFETLMIGSIARVAALSIILFRQHLRLTIENISLLNQRVQALFRLSLSLSLPSCRTTSCVHVQNSRLGKAGR
jgi:hypothetical protein